MRTSSKLIQKYYHVRVGHKLAGIIGQVDTVSLIAARMLAADFTAVFYRAGDRRGMIPVSFQYGHHLSIRKLDELERYWANWENEAVSIDRGIAMVDGSEEAGESVECAFGKANGFACRYQYPLFESGQMSAVFLAYWYEKPAAISRDTEVTLDLVGSILTAALSIADQLMIVENYSSRLSDLLDVFEVPFGDIAFKDLVADVVRRASHIVPEAALCLLSRDSETGRLVPREQYGRHVVPEHLFPGLSEHVEVLLRSEEPDNDTRKYRCRDVRLAESEQFADLVALPIVPSPDIQLVLVIASSHERALTQNDRELLAVFAAFAQTVLRNALLVKSLRKANRLLERSSTRLANAETMAALTDMTSGVAHDFNNIFGGIIGRIQLLKYRVKDPQILSELDMVEKLTTEGADTVRRIQEFSTSGQRKDVGPVDLADLIGSVLEDRTARWHKLSEENAIRVETRIMTDGAVVEGTDSDLAAVIRKMIENAVEHSPRGGRVEVVLDASEKNVRVSVSDHGPGIPEDTRKKVFYPFYTSKTERGAGLGLAIVHGIVSRLGGRVDIETTEGGGATFIVTMRRSEVAGEVTEKITLKRRADRLRILVVDDDQQIRDVLKDMLTINGHKTVACADGYAALDALKRDPYDILITDLGMPGLSGLDLAGEAHEQNPAMPIAMITGWGTQLDQREMALKGIKAVLPKPFHLKDIKALVEELTTA